jgi:hypothetical protein
MIDSVLPRPAPRWRLKPATISLIMLVALVPVHLLCPDRSENSRQVRLCRFLNYSFNPDSGEYALLVVKFPGGFKEYPGRTARPGYPALGFLVYQPLRLLKPLIPDKLVQSVRSVEGDASVWKGVDMRDVILAWVAMVVVNLLVYWLSLLLVLKSFAQIFAPAVALVLTFYLAVHRDTIAFLLIPNAECFNLLLPAIFLYTVTLVWPRKSSGNATALALGLGVLGKGILFPFGNWLYEHLMIRPWRSTWRTALICCLLFGLPMVCYWTLVRAAGLRFVNQDVDQYRYFVWMADYIHADRFLDIPGHWLHNLLVQFKNVATYWTVALGLCLVLLPWKGRTDFTIGKTLRAHLLVYAACGVAFMVAGGMWQARMSIFYYPTILVLLGALATRRLARPLPWLILGVAVSLAVYIVQTWPGA